MERARLRAIDGRREEAVRCLEEARRLSEVVDWGSGRRRAEQALKSLRPRGSTIH